MAWSTIAQLRARLPQINGTGAQAQSDAWCTARIVQADEWVQDQLFTQLGTLPAVAAADVSLLAQYAAIVEALDTLYGPQRAGEDKSDRKGALQKRDDKLEMFRRGQSQSCVAGVSTNKDLSGLQPAFGYGEYGERAMTSEAPTTSTDIYEEQEEI